MSEVITAAEDHALIAAALCSGAGRWEPNEFCIGGLRYSTRLDPFGVPVMTAGMHAAISEALEPNGYGLFGAGLTAERDSARKDAASWKSHWEMYAQAWLRELGGRLIAKRHQIDAFVLTTRALKDKADKADAIIAKHADDEHTRLLAATLGMELIGREALAERLYLSLRRGVRIAGGLAELTWDELPNAEQDRYRTAIDALGASPAPKITITAALKQVEELEAGLGLLHQAIVALDPHRELKVRAGDLQREAAALVRTLGAELTT